MIQITQEMLDVAQQEVKRRNPNLKPHFEVAYLKQNIRLIIGFLGEFACQEYFGLNWLNNIRDNYVLADDYDFMLDGCCIDVKTETLNGENLLQRVYQRSISDDETFGRRLINENQCRILNKYDVVIFGCMLRPNKDDPPSSLVGKYWYPIGSISTYFILQNYQPTRDRPEGNGKQYPQPCVSIRTSELEALPPRFIR